MSTKNLYMSIQIFIWNKQNPELIQMFINEWTEKLVYFPRM